MSKTLLAVDDSATMRKVLEITFGGEDFTVVTADTSQTALSRMNEKPAAVVIDTVLGGDDGYALCKEIRKRDPNAAIVLLASRYSPYDAAKGKDAGADDFMDKPFDTQQMLDKVRKVMLAKESTAVATPTAAAAQSAAPAARPPAPAYPSSAAPAKPEAKAGIPGRSQTLVFGEDTKAPPAPTKPLTIDAPKPTPGAGAVASGGSVGGSGASPVNGGLAGRLGDLGLSPAQADAVLALSRELVERVVWEVVPQLAEAIIKEEISRLTKP